MAQIELIMPKMGESVAEATIIKWLKNEGDKIAVDEPVLEIATDKVDSEVPSTAAGVIEEILFNVNDVVPIGTVIARIRTSAEQAASHEPRTTSPDIQNTQPKIQEAEVVGTTQPSTYAIATADRQTSNGSSNRFYSPLVLNIAASEGVSMTELENIPGTGNEGRVTKKDIL